jgi:hypothetical protein
MMLIELSIVFEHYSLRPVSRHSNIRRWNNKKSTMKCLLQKVAPLVSVKKECIWYKILSKLLGGGEGSGPLAPHPRSVRHRLAETVNSAFKFEVTFAV